MLFLYILTSIIGKIGWSIQQSSMNRQAYKNTYNPKTNTYIDWKGCKRDATTNKPHIVINDRNGDRVQKNEKWDTIRNFSEEERNREYKNNNNYSVYPMSDVILGQYELKGIRYKDKRTGRLYVVRAFDVYDKKTNNRRCVKFFMDDQTLHLVRVVDFGDWVYQYISKDTIDEFINEFNYKQDHDDYLNALYWKKYYNENNSCLSVNKSNQNKRRNIYE